MLEGVEWQVAQFRVQLHAVVEAVGVISDVRCRLGMVGVVALPNPLHLHKDHGVRSPISHATTLGRLADDL